MHVCYVNINASLDKQSISYFRSKFNSKRKGGVIFLYEKYERLLIERNLTSYKVSQDTGIAQSSLSDWKRGISNPKVDKLKILAKYFDIPVDYFLDE